MRHFLFSLLILFSGIFYSAGFVLADDKQDLQSIRQSIQEKERKLAEQKKQRVKLIADLKKQETAIANLLASIEKNESLLNSLATEITSLNTDIAELENKQAKQKKILAKQLEGAFKLGKTRNIELIFSGQESERNERIITYYGYINQERQTRINDLKEIQDKLNQKKLSLEQKHNQQQAIQDKQKAEKDDLLANQKERQKTIAGLDASMQLNQQKLEELKENEAKLQAQIIKAEQENKKLAEEEARQATQIQAKQQSYNYKPTKDESALMARVSGIGKPAHKLDWPVLGRILHSFGEPLQGELKWKGLVISAKEGAKVQAIADGRVILASWLQGYGFIVAVDHGKGDMSLYGYNQRVLVNVGDKVEAGQSIALVGSSGGQGKPSLYFEIRRDGKALDPSVWLRK